jgi:hypothetical protein
MEMDFECTQTSNFPLSGVSNNTEAPLHVLCVVHYISRAISDRT